MINGGPCDGAPGPCPCPPPSKGCPVLDDDSGCPTDWFCTESEFGTDGEPCFFSFAYCPEDITPSSCPSGQTICPGEKAPNGCRIAPDYCCPLA